MSGSVLDVSKLQMRFADNAPALFSIPELHLAAGESLGISGPSGAGKTTLFNCLAGITQAAQGSIRWGDSEITSMSERMRDRWRHRTLGLIFQDFHLIDGLSALDNVLLPANFDSFRIPAALRERASSLLSRVGVDTGKRLSALLSRGERQRVAIARALLFAPAVLMADEPTASLDPEHRERVTELLLALAREQGATLIVISHESALLSRMARRCVLQDGSLREQS